MKINLSEDPRWHITKHSEGNTELLKVPVAVMGVWEHPEYGRLEFSQQDFDEMQSNWERNVLGYEPPLLLGHNVDPNNFGGEPAVAFPVSFQQEADVFFGLYEPVDRQVFQDVKDGKFRYSSSETIRNAKSKETGKPIGTVLTANALTNRPFLTRMPRVEVVQQQLAESSDRSVASFVFPVFPVEEKEIPMPETTPAATPVAVATPEAQNVAEVAERFSKLAESNEALRLQNERLETENQELKASVETANQQLAQLTTNVQVIMERANKQDLSDKLRRANNLNLPAEVRQEFCQKLSEGFFTPEMEAYQFGQLQKLSEQNRTSYTKQQGNPTVEEAVLEKSNNAYADVIEANHKLAEARRNSQKV